MFGDENQAYYMQCYNGSSMQYRVSIQLRSTIVRFAHNWNTGVLERWNNGFK